MGAPVPWYLLDVTKRVPYASLTEAEHVLNPCLRTFNEALLMRPDQAFASLLLSSITLVHCVSFLPGLMVEGPAHELNGKQSAKLQIC